MSVFFCSSILGRAALRPPQVLPGEPATCLRLVEPRGEASWSYSLPCRQACACLASCARASSWTPDPPDLLYVRARPSEPAQAKIALERRLAASRSGLDVLPPASVGRLLLWRFACSPSLPTTQLVFLPPLSLPATPQPTPTFVTPFLLPPPQPHFRAFFTDVCSPQYRKLLQQPHRLRSR